MSSVPWSNNEVELIINDYFSMLKDEISGKPVNKAMHRKSLIPLLQNRTDGSIEFKHQNISAVLINLGQPYIRAVFLTFERSAQLVQSIPTESREGRHNKSSPVHLP